jgi:hypothetical protein
MELQQVTGNRAQAGTDIAKEQAEGKKMIEGYIVDKLKRKKEELERQQWQPIPLPLEEYDPTTRQEKEKKSEKPREFVVEFLFSGGINGFPTRA